MKTKYKIIRMRFNQIISEKNIGKQRRNKSFIQSHNKYIEEKIERNSTSSNHTKNSFYLKEKQEDKTNILNKKFNVLKKTLEKLQFIIEKNIKNELDLTLNILNEVKKLKNNFINEIINDKELMDNNYLKKGENITKKIENNGNKMISNNIKIILDDNLNNINNQLNKLNIYSNMQNNYFNNINEDINEQFNNINVIYNEIKQNEVNSEQNIEKIKNKIKNFDNKENIKREKFREDIFSILNIELNKIIK